MPKQLGSTGLGIKKQKRGSSIQDQLYDLFQVLHSKSMAALGLRRTGLPSVLCPNYVNSGLILSSKLTVAIEHGPFIVDSPIKQW